MTCLVNVDHYFGSIVEEQVLIHLFSLISSKYPKIQLRILVIESSMQLPNNLTTIVHLGMASSLKLISFIEIL